MSKKIKYLLIILIIGILLYVGVSFISVHNFLSPKRAKIDFPDTLNLVHKDIEFKTSDNINIKGWFFPSDSVNSTKAIILCHGWTANRYETLPRVKFLLKAGYNVLTYDARACGESGGDLISLGYYEANDLLAAIDYLKSKGIKKIAADGISQGGATIVFASEKSKDLQCIIIESCFDELRNAVNNRFSSMLHIPGAIGSALMIPIAKDKLGVSVDEIAPIKVIGKIDISVFVMSGEADTRTTKEETKKLFNAVNDTKQLWLVPNAIHEDLYRVNTVEYEKRVLEFLKENIVTEFDGKATDSYGFLTFMDEQGEGFIRTGNTTYLQTLNKISRVSDGAVAEYLDGVIERIIENRPADFIKFIYKIKSKEDENNLDIAFLYSLIGIKEESLEKFNSVKKKLQNSVKENKELQNYLLKIFEKAEKWK